jgi:hypothetical protein
MHGMGHTRQQEIVEETSDEVVAEGAHHTVNGTEVEDSTDEHAVHAAQQPDRGRGRTRWLFIAAAPVVSFVTLALVLCFQTLLAVVEGSCGGDPRVPLCHIQTQKKVGGQCSRKQYMHARIKFSVSGM